MNLSRRQFLIGSTTIVAAAAVLPLPVESDTWADLSGNGWDLVPETLSTRGSVLRLYNGTDNNLLATIYMPEDPDFAPVTLGPGESYQFITEEIHAAD